MGVAKIEMATSDMWRQVAKEADILVRNRFVEKNPVLSDGQPAHIARPGLKFWQNVGTGAIRAIFHQPGAFDDDVFVVSGGELYRLDRVTGAQTLLDDTLAFGDTDATVIFACTGDFGTPPTGVGPRLFFTDGQTLKVYMEDGFATGRLTASAVPSDGDIVRLGSVYYRFSSGSLDSGSPDGTSGNPWRVLITGTAVGSLTKLYHAINASGVPGTDYSTDLTDPNPDAVATSATTTGLFVRATAAGGFGNIVVTTETGANLSWTQGGTLTNGGTPSIVQIPTPDEVGVISIANINQFIIVIPTQGAGLNGRFYWIMPAEVEIDPLNFATAESSADPIYQVVVFNDQFWLLGQDTTEIWYMTGDADNPVSRLQGVVFNRGIHQGTALLVKNFIVLVDTFGGVFTVAGQEQRISNPDIEERIRRAIAKQAIMTGI
jgi:hypothetical protein